MRQTCSEPSLKELIYAAGGNLKLLDQVRHEPFVVGVTGEIAVSLALDVDVVGLRLNLRNVLHCSFVRADLIQSANEEGHGHLLDVGHWDKISLSLTIQPVVGELLEAVRKAIHDPVLLRIDGLTL